MATPRIGQAKAVATPRIGQLDAAQLGQLPDLPSTPSIGDLSAKIGGLSRGPDDLAELQEQERSLVGAFLERHDALPEDLVRKLLTYTRSPERTAPERLFFQLGKGGLKTVEKIGDLIMRAESAFLATPITALLQGLGITDTSAGRRVLDRGVLPSMLDALGGARDRVSLGELFIPDEIADTSIPWLTPLVGAKLGSLRIVPDIFASPLTYVTFGASALKIPVGPAGRIRWVAPTPELRALRDAYTRVARDRLIRSYSKELLRDYYRGTVVRPLGPRGVREGGGLVTRPGGTFRNLETPAATQADDMLWLHFEAIRRAEMNAPLEAAKLLDDALAAATDLGRLVDPGGVKLFGHTIVPTEPIQRVVGGALDRAASRWPAAKSALKKGGDLLDRMFQEMPFLARREPLYLELRSIGRALEDARRTPALEYFEEHIAKLLPEDSPAWIQIGHYMRLRGHRENSAMKALDAIPADERAVAERIVNELDGINATMATNELHAGVQYARGPRADYWPQRYGNEPEDWERLKAIIQADPVFPEEVKQSLGFGQFAMSKVFRDSDEAVAYASKHGLKLDPIHDVREAYAMRIQEHAQMLAAAEVRDHMMHWYATSANDIDAAVFKKVFPEVSRRVGKAAYAAGVKKGGMPRATRALAPEELDTEIRRGLAAMDPTSPAYDDIQSHAAELADAFVTRGRAGVERFLAGRGHGDDVQADVVATIYAAARLRPAQGGLNPESLRVGHALVIEQQLAEKRPAATRLRKVARRRPFVRGAADGEGDAARFVYESRTIESVEEGRAVVREILYNLKPRARAQFLLGAVRNVERLEDLNRVLDDYGRFFDQLDPRLVQSARDEIGITTRKLLDGFGRPYELAPPSLPDFKGMYLPRGIIQHLTAELAQGGFVPRWLRPVLAKYDAIFNEPWKLAQTAPWPGFHVRNKTSDIAQAWVEIGLAAASPRLHRHAVNVISGVDGVVEVAGRKVGYDYLRYMSRHLGVTKSARQTFDVAVADVDNVVRRGVDLVTRPGQRFGTWNENESRMMLWLYHVMQGDAPVVAAGRVNRLFFDYASLSEAAKQIFRRLFPFWTWTAKNIRLAAAQATRRPGRLSAQIKLQAHDFGPDEAFLPEYQAGALQIGVQRQGKQLFFTGLDMPVAAALEMTWPSDARELFRNWVAMAAPWRSWIDVYGFGRDPFSMRDLGPHARQYVSGMPEIVRKVGAAVPGLEAFFEFRDQVDPETGRRFQTVNAAKFHIFVKGSLLARMASTQQRLVRYLSEEEPDFWRALWDYGLGVRVDEFDLADRERAIIKRNIATLNRMMRARGYTYTFDIVAPSRRIDVADIPPYRLRELERQAALDARRGR